MAKRSLVEPLSPQLSNVLPAFVRMPYFRFGGEWGILHFIEVDRFRFPTSAALGGDLAPCTLPRGNVRCRITPAGDPYMPTSEPAPIIITYTNHRGVAAKRIITPITCWYGSTEWHPEPQWLLRAYDEQKQAIRDFALKDVGGSMPCPQTFLSTTPGYLAQLVGSLASHIAEAVPENCPTEAWRERTDVSVSIKLTSSLALFGLVLFALQDAISLANRAKEE